MEIKFSGGLRISAMIFVILGLVTLACIAPFPISRTGVNPKFVESAGVTSPTQPSTSITGLMLPTHDESRQFCQVLQSPFVVDLNTYQTPSLDIPNPRTSFHDPVFGTCMARISDRDEDLHSNDPSTGIRTNEAGVQSFNADGTLILLRSTENFWYVYSVTTLTPVLTLPINGSHEVYWDPGDPNSVYFFKGSRLFRFNVQGGHSKFIHNFAQDFSNQRVTWVGANNASSISQDGRYWGLFAEDHRSNSLAILIYDIENDRIAAQVNLPEATHLRSVRLSPHGNYLLADFESDCASELPPLGEEMCGLVAYDSSLENPRQILLMNAVFDTALDQNLNEVLIYHDTSMDAISMLNLGSGEKEALWLIEHQTSFLDFNISGRALHRPGWILISTYNGSFPEDTSWMDNSIFAIELAPQGRVARLAHNHFVTLEKGSSNDWAQPQASPNLDFTRIIFSSNWGRFNEGEVETYIIALPENWVSILP